MSEINWQHTPPPESGVYVTSISRKTNTGEHVFTYVGYYDQEDGRWYRHTPWDDNNNPQKGEIIEDQILGWYQSAAYFGLLPRR